MENVIVNDVDLSNLITSFEQYDEIDKDMIIGSAVSTQIKIKIRNKDNQLNNLLDYPFLIGNKSYIVYEKPEKWTKTVSLTLYDLMIKTNIAYATTLEYPTTVSNQLDEMQKLTGLIIDKSTLSDDLLNKTVGWYDSTMIIRNYLGFIAQCDGKNAYIEEDKVVFKKIADSSHVTEFSSNYDLNELVTFTRVCFDDGAMIPLSKGTSDGHTLYLSSNNLYVEQIDIDRIYDMYNGLSFYSFKSFKCRDIENVMLTDIVSYNDISILPLSIKRTVNGGEAKDSLEMSADITLKNADSVIVKEDPVTRIRKVQTIVDQNEASIMLLAKNQENTEEKIGQLEINIDEINSSVKKITNMVTNSDNIFSNCNQTLTKNSTNKNTISIDNMPLAITKESLRNEQICVSFSFSVTNGVIGSLDGYLGVEFDVTYDDYTTETISLRYYLGEIYLQYLLNTGVSDLNVMKNIYQPFMIADKDIQDVSNLRMIISCNGDNITMINPKVNFGDKPISSNSDMNNMVYELNSSYTIYSSLSQTIAATILEMFKSNVLNETTTQSDTSRIQLDYDSITQIVKSTLGESEQQTSFKQYDDHIDFVGDYFRIDGQLYVKIDDNFYSVDSLLGKALFLVGSGDGYIEVCDINEIDNSVNLIEEVDNDGDIQTDV